METGETGVLNCSVINSCRTKFACSPVQDYKYEPEGDFCITARSRHMLCNPDSGILANFSCGIGNPEIWNPEFSSRNLESHLRLKFAVFKNKEFAHQTDLEPVTDKMSKKYISLKKKKLDLLQHLKVCSYFDYFRFMYFFSLYHLCLAGFLITLSPNGPFASDRFFRPKTISEVAILKTNSATIAFFLLLLSLSSLFLFLLSSCFVTMILELLGLKKPAF